jgi:hypothetical protein
MSFINLLIVLALLPCCALGQSARSEDKGDAAGEALEVVNRLFDAMRRKDAEAMRALFSAEGQLTATQRRDGQPSLRVYNGDAFAKLIVETKGVLKERLLSRLRDRDDVLSRIEDRHRRAT